MAKMRYQKLSEKLERWETRERRIKGEPAKARAMSRKMNLLSGAEAKEFGVCPKCRSLRWYDNRPGKKSGRIKPNAPEAVCAGCKHCIWPAR